MNDNRSKRIRKRAGAGLLAVWIALTSIQVPAGIVYAEETAAVTEDAADSAGDTKAPEQPQEEGSMPETGNDRPGSGEAAGDEEKAEPGEDGSGLDAGGTEVPKEGSGEGEEGSEEPDSAGETDNTDGTESAEDTEEHPSGEEGNSSGNEAGGGEPSEGEDGDTVSVSGNDFSEGDLPEMTEEEAGIGAVALEAGEDSLNIANLSAEYTALDGTTISSAAQGRPKLLIFYSNGCYNSQSTIRSISGKISDFSGVDVCAIETNKNTQESVLAFQKDYGCSGIAFSYDTGAYNSSSMWNYVRAGGLDDSGGIKWPVICYIDADNFLQYVTTSIQTADGVLDNLEKFCEYKIEVLEGYQITYVLCGGTNHNANPAVYTSAMDTVVLQDASRSGHRFEGWYKEAAYATRVTQISKDTAADMTIYAKWSPLSASGQPEIDMTPAEGNLVMGFSGSYYTESADKILERLNQIRLEACREGVRNPSTGKPLTLADYVPLYWSSDLEAIARIRAAEATVSQNHTRPNGERCFTAITTNNEGSYAENLAWNYSGMMQGIEQWYGEKKDWVNQNTGAVTGHYTSMINPGYRAVGLGAFRLTSGGWYAVAQEFSHKDTLDAYKNPGQGSCVQYLEVQGSNVTALKFGSKQAAFIREGDTYRLSLNVTAAYKDYYGTKKSFSGAYQAGGKWSSSNEETAVVDGTGVISARAKGTAVIGVEAGKESASVTITVYGKDESPILIQNPAKTTYTVGQKLDVTGGKVTYMVNGTTETKDMTAGMLEGFDSSKPGICPVTVVCDGYAASFDTLIVEEPKVEQKAAYGQRLSGISLPSNAHGVYSWQDGTQILKEVGTRSYAAEFTPNDEERFQKLTDLQIEVITQRALGSDFEIAFKNNRFTYNGAEQEPKVVITASDGGIMASQGSGIVLVEEQDYLLSYQNNRNTGIATVTAEGIGNYTGSITGTFEIKPAPLVIRAKDKTILLNSGVPGTDAYEYEISGLMPGDALVSGPILSCDIVDTKVAGRYPIVPQDADAGTNYTVSYKNGRLTVASELVSCEVVFDVQGHGTAPAGQVGIKVGGTIERPEEPSEAGYRFGGWYQDKACTKAWNFDEDIVQCDLILYAKWLHESTEGGLALQEIGDVYYTGKACKPAVSVYDGDTLLKAGRDYQVKYYNNINANKDGKQKRGNGEGVYFDAELPYVEITGRKNYTDTVKINFNILRASIGDEENNPAAEVVLKVSEQLAAAKRIQKPFTSIKYGRTMRLQTDYALRLTVVNARDQAGRPLPEELELDDAAVPAGYEGAFALTVQGQGNYEGSICKTIYVADKQYLMKNTRVTLGANQKNVVFDGAAVELTPSESDSADTFTVRYGSKILRYKKDYDIAYYRNHDKVGKAEMVLTGIGAYSGEKIVPFNIKGSPFTTRNVAIDGMEDKEYTGRSLTQNGVALTYAKGTADEQKLQYGEDYTISYAKNVNKGTATMTFRGNEEGGFTGSIRKTFKITAADITQTEQAAGMQNITVRYCKTGAKPVEEIVLTSKEGIRLVNGKDYTLRYINNKSIADKADEKPPAVIVKGRGNYTGELPVYYNIVKGDLQGETIRINVSAVAFRQNQAADYTYRPSVKVTDGKSRLRAGVDYEITYENNTQSDYENYLRYLEEQGTDPGTGQDADIPQAPRVLITGKPDSSYTVSSGEPIYVLLPIYRNKLTKSNLEVEIEKTIYTGKQATPAVTVYYQGENGRILLTEGKDYRLSYGANISSGKKKGSVTISGMGPYYGGNVTVKFDIGRKMISY